MSSVQRRFPQDAAARGNADIRSFMRPIAVSTLLEAKSRDGQVVSVTHVNNIDVQICINCKQRQVGNEVKRCGFSDWCNVCDASLWATNPDVICTGVTGVIPAAVSLSAVSNVSLSAAPQTVTYKRNHFIESDDDVAGCKRKISRKKKINEDSSENDSFTSKPSLKQHHASVKKAERKRYHFSVIIHFIVWGLNVMRIPQVDDDDSELDKKHRFEGEAEEHDASDEDDEESNESNEENQKEGDDSVSDVCDAVSDACAALRNRRRFKVSNVRYETHLKLKF